MSIVLNLHIIRYGKIKTKNYCNEVFVVEEVHGMGGNNPQSLKNAKKKRTGFFIKDYLYLCIRMMANCHHTKIVAFTQRLFLFLRNSRKILTLKPRIGSSRSHSCMHKYVLRHFCARKHTAYTSVDICVARNGFKGQCEKPRRSYWAAKDFTLYVFFVQRLAANPHWWTN